MTDTLNRLAHRYRIAKDLGLEEGAAEIAIQIAEQVQKEMEEQEEIFTHIL